MLCDALIALLFIVFPLRYFFLVDPETVVEPVIDYFTFEGPFLSAEQPGKHPPLDQPDITHSLLSYSCIRFATVVDSIAPILLHSLSLLLQLLIPLPAIVMLSMGC